VLVINQSHRGSSMRHPQGAPPTGRPHASEPLLGRAGGSQPNTYSLDCRHRTRRQATSIQNRLVGWVGGKPRRHTRAPLSHHVRAHAATLAEVRPVDRLTRGQDSHALAIWLTSQTYCFVIMHVCVLFGGLFLASPLPLSPDCAPPRTRPVRARVPGLAPPELLFKRALARASGSRSRVPRHRSYV